MTAPLFDAPTPAACGVAAAAIARLDQLRQADLIGPADEITAAQVEHLAFAVQSTTKAYALAQLNRELSDTLDRLPSEPVAKDAEPFERLRAFLLELRAESSGREPTYEQ